MLSFNKSNVYWELSTRFPIILESEGLTITSNNVSSINLDNQTIYLSLLNQFHGLCKYFTNSCLLWLQCFTNSFWKYLPEPKSIKLVKNTQKTCSNFHKLSGTSGHQREIKLLLQTYSTVQWLNLGRDITTLPNISWEGANWISHWGTQKNQK